jgi:PTS system nitrogen regulatory IIA component
MKIVDYLPAPVIEPDLKGSDRSVVLSELIASLQRHHGGLDVKEALRVLEEREKLGSTGIGGGVAIPHSIDALPAHLFFLIIAPENSVGVHLSLLARISRICGDEAVRRALMGAADAGEMRRVIDEADRNE